MPKAKKLPSGSWRCQVYSHTDETGKRVYKSFTCQDPSSRGKRKCEAEAAAWASSKENAPKTKKSMTFGQCVDEYIEARKAVMSPATVKLYKGYRRSALQDLMDIDVSKITNTAIQKAVSKEALKNEPKTVKNKFGLVTAVLSVYRPDMKLNVKLPQKKKTEVYMPPESDIQKILSASEGTPLEIPILLAIFGPLRRSETCALLSSDLEGNVLKVRRSMALDDDNNWVIKQPKTFAGNRDVILPDFVADKLRGHEGRIVELTPTAVTKRFIKLLKKEGIRPFTFHRLRHYSASLLHSMNIPDVYIKKRAGWDSDYALKYIYRHALEEKEKEANQTANEAFKSIYATRNATRT